MAAELPVVTIVLFIATGALVCVSHSSSSSSGNVQRPSSVIIDMYWGITPVQRGIPLCQLKKKIVVMRK
jgi:hypothetical protein